MFTKDKVQIYNANKRTETLLEDLNQAHELALSGERDKNNGLWRTSLKKQQVNSMLKTTTIEEQMQFLHAAAGYPVPSTWIKAIQKGYYISWPGLTADNVRRYLPKSPITSRGHIKQLRKNTNSTKNLLEDENLAVDPQQTDDNIKTHQMFAAICEEGKIYTDQTGCFPQLSSKGTKYIMIIYVYDANAILTVGLKSRMAGELVRGYQSIYQYLQTKGYKP